MKAEFIAIIEAAPESGYWEIFPEVSSANGQGEMVEETKSSLRQAIELILEDRKADILRGLPEDKIYLVGNVMADSLLHNVEKAKRRKMRGAICEYT